MAPTIDPISDPTANPPPPPPPLLAALLVVAAAAAAGAVPESVLDGGVGAVVVELGGEADCVTATADDDAVMAGCGRSDTAAVLTPPTVWASVCSRVKRAP